MTDASQLSAAQSPERGGDYRVAVFATPSGPDELSELLEKQLSLHPTDARIHAHAVPGLLPNRLRREEAESLAAAVASLGLACHVFHQKEIPDLDGAVTVHHARCTDAGFEIFGLKGESERVVPWAEFELLSIGDVPGEAAHHFQFPVIRALHAAPTPTMPPITAPNSTGPEAWLSTPGATELFRIEHEQMNYEALGDRKTTSAARNFRTFITDVSARIPHAYLTPAARAYLEHGFVRHFLFHSREEFQRYTQFHILLRHRLQEAGG
jgi:hypothetical protein